jgi:hypothetical protein
MQRGEQQQCFELSTWAWGERTSQAIHEKLLVIRLINHIESHKARSRESSEAIATRLQRCQLHAPSWDTNLPEHSGLRVQTLEQFGLPLRKKAKSPVSIIHWKQLHLYNSSTDCKRKKH